MNVFSIHLVAVCKASVLFATIDALADGSDFSFLPTADLRDLHAVLQSYG